MYTNIIVVAVMSFDDDYYELNFWYGWPMKDVKLYFQPGAVSEILIISNL